jgi:L-seryl-tRNA(Ser) seleniumtransferase
MSSDMDLSILPSVDRVLGLSEVSALTKRCDLALVTEFVREAIDETRQSILAGEMGQCSPDSILPGIVASVRGNMDQVLSSRFRKVINATGIVLHTNMGRAPLPQTALDQISKVAGGYSNLELDLVSGQRGSRIDLVEDLLCRLTGAEAAAVVNNNAAAVLISLNTLAFGRDALVSRGELVEIGGSFRIPDIMSKSGANMIEVGTTNRTHLKDFESAITNKTGVMLAVHPSNYRVLGFTADVTIEELAELGARHEVPVVHDLGGGVLKDLGQFGLPHEPVVSESVFAGADVVTFSGDKILGGPQAGVIVGKRAAVDAIQKNPLMRALRCGKLTYAALEATLQLFMNPDELLQTHPTLRMFTESVAALSERGERVARALKDLSDGGTIVEIVESVAQAGSGTLPLEELESVALVITSENPSVTELARRLRRDDPAIVGYINDDKLYLDLKTVDEKEVDLLEAGIRRATTT